MTGNRQERFVRLLGQLARSSTHDDELSDLDDSELELIAAYVEQQLTPAERERCEQLLARNRAALGLAADLWEARRAESMASPTPPATPAVSAAPKVWWAVAASLLVAAATGGWALYTGRSESRMEDELASERQQRVQDQQQLCLLSTTRFLEQAPSPVRAFWMGSVTPEILQFPMGRGDAELTPMAAARAEETRQHLESLADAPRQAGLVQLELASVEIAAGRLTEARKHLEKADGLLGAEPAALNLRAVWLLAQQEQDRQRQGEASLRQITRTHSDFAPAWYNLALYLELDGRLAESRTAWTEYLKREQRPAYRQIAEAHLATTL